MAVKDVVGALDEIREAIEENGSELPAVTSTDNGKILKVVNGKWDKGDAPSGLPAVTSEDNGDVLTVVEGQWAKAAASGGVFFVTCSYNENTTTLNKTWKEISEATEENVVVFVHPSNVTGVEGNVYSTLASCIYSSQLQSYIVDTFYMVPGEDNVYHETYFTQSETGNPVHTRITPT